VGNTLGEQQSLPIAECRLSGSARPHRLRGSSDRRLQAPSLDMGFLAVLVIGLVKEFVIDIFGKEHDTFMSSLKDFTFYMVGAAAGMVVATVK